MYHQLLDTHLRVPAWKIRMVRFAGTNDERAEEFQFLIRSNQVNQTTHSNNSTNNSTNYIDRTENTFGVIERYTHIVPESFPGAKLSETEARVIAHKALISEFSLDPEKVIEIAANSKKYDARIDWTFTFKDPNIYPLKDGEARIGIEVAGDEITDTARYIHTPEQWSRDEQNRMALKNMIPTLSWLLLGLLIALGMFICFMTNPRALHARFIAPLFGALVIIYFINLLNNIPISLSYFETQSGFINQVFRVFGPAIMGIFITSGLYTAWIGLTSNQPTISKVTHNPFYFILSICFGLFVAGITIFTKNLIPSSFPLWASFTGLGSYFPFLAISINHLTGFISATAMLLFLIALIEYISQLLPNNRLGNRIITIAIFILYGFMVGAECALDNWYLFITQSLVAGAVTTFAYYSLFRHDRALIPGNIAGVLLLNILRQAIYQAHPQALYGHLIGGILIIISAWIWFKNMNKQLNLSVSENPKK